MTERETWKGKVGIFITLILAGLCNYFWFVSWQAGAEKDILRLQQDYLDLRDTIRAIRDQTNRLDERTK